jgi:hypothetical protein
LPQSLGLADETEGRIELVAGELRELVVVELEHLGRSDAAQHAVEQSPTRRSAIAEQLAHEQATEQAARFAPRHQEAEAVRRMAQRRGPRAQRDDRDRRVLDRVDPGGRLAVELAQQRRGCARRRRNHESSCGPFQGRVHSAGTRSRPGDDAKAGGDRLDALDGRSEPGLAPQPGGEPARQLAEPAGQRERARATALLGRGTAQRTHQQAPHDRAVLAFGLDQGGEDRIGTEAPLVAGVDAGQERSDQRIDELGTEPACDEFGHGLGAPITGRDEGLAQQPAFRAAREQRSAGQRERTERHGDQTPTAQQPAGTARGRCAHQAVGEPEALEPAQQRCAQQQRVGAALDAVPVHLIGSHDAARRVRRVHEHHLGSTPLELTRRRETGNPRADDQGVDVRDRAHAAASARAASVKARTPSTGVSGRQPCPRLTM